ncbi:MAG: hypothetical protein ACRBM6_06335 [Geminicoccales bacterium]
MASRYDILMVSDLRFPGGTGTVIAHEIEACHRAGYRLGILNIRASLLKYPHPINPKIRALIDAGKIDLLDPDGAFDCPLCLIYHPQTLAHLPLKPLRIHAETTRLVVNHPCLDGRGKPFYDWAAIANHADILLDDEVPWSPVGPLVRQQWSKLKTPPPLADHDWPGIIDAASWRAEVDAAPEHDRSGDHFVIGRHSRPDPMKWPDTREQLLDIYPADPRIGVSILGGGPFLEALADPMPPHWEVWGFNQIGSAELLRNIDLFVYYHHSQWVEAFGIAILEALAAGRVALLSPHFEELFGAAALYAEPAQVSGVIERLSASPEARTVQQAQAIQVVQDRFSYEAHRERLKALIGKPSSKMSPISKAAIQHPAMVSPPPSKAVSQSAPKVGGLRKRVLFFSSNGIGMGHLTRQLAIARRLGDGFEPVFITMSQAAQYVEKMGFPVEYIPFHAYLDCDITAWNRCLHRDLAERLDFYRPDVIVFDGNVPYDGLLRALAARPAIMSIWCRRAMWIPGAGEDHIARERHFDIVIEPGELAAIFDHGLTTTHRDRTRQVAPIQLLSKGEMPIRDDARFELGLDLDRPAILFQLGSGNNFDFGNMLDDMLDWLVARDELQLVWLDWAIAQHERPLPSRIKRLRLYPIARYLNAFDYGISAAGYNAYHELMRSGVPTLFMPNENPMMDDQLSRALYAQQYRLGDCLRRQDLYRLGDVLSRFLDPIEHDGRRQRLAKIAFSDGAAEAARIIEEAAFSISARCRSMPEAPADEPGGAITTP